MSYNLTQFWCSLPGDNINPIVKCSVETTTHFCCQSQVVGPQVTYNFFPAPKSLQSCPTLCDPIDGSPRGSPIPGILQARILEWVAISFSNAWKWKVKGKSLSHIWLLATPWTAAYQAPLPMGFSRQEYWSGLPLLSPLHELVTVISSLVIPFYGWKC